MLGFTDHVGGHCIHHSAEDISTLLFECFWGIETVNFSKWNVRSAQSKHLCMVALLSEEKRRRSERVVALKPATKGPPHLPEPFKYSETPTWSNTLGVESKESAPSVLRMLVSARTSFGLWRIILIWANHALADDIWEVRLMHTPDRMSACPV